MNCAAGDFDVARRRFRSSLSVVFTEMSGAPGQPPRPRKMASWWRVATVQWDLDLPKFYEQFFQLMSR